MFKLRIYALLFLVFQTQTLRAMHAPAIRAVFSKDCDRQLFNLYLENNHIMP